MKILIICLIVTLSVSCKRPNSSNVLSFPVFMQQEMQKMSNHNQVIVYYHSGDCSFCYADMMSFAKEYPKVPLISICSIEDTVLINFYLDRINFEGVSLIDSSSSFKIMNHLIISKFNVFLIDSSNNILAETVFLDNKSKKAFTNELDK